MAIIAESINQGYIAQKPPETINGKISNLTEHLLYRSTNAGNKVVKWVKNSDLAQLTRNLPIESLQNFIPDKNQGLKDIATISREAYAEVKLTGLFDPARAIEEIIKITSNAFENYELINGPLADSDPELKTDLTKLKTNIKACKPGLEQSSSQIFGAEQLKAYKHWSNPLQLVQNFQRILPEIRFGGGTAIAATILGLTGLGTAAGLAVFTGAAITKAINHYKQENHNQGDIANRLDSPGDMAVIAHTMAGIGEQIKRPIAYQDLSTLTDFIKNNNANITFLDALGKSGSNTSFWIGKTMLPQAKVLKEIMEYRLVEMVKDLEQEALGRKQQIINGVTVVNEKPTKYDLLEVEHKLNQILPFLENKNHPSLKRLRNIIDPHIAQDSLITSDLSGHATKLESLITESEAKLKDLEERMAKGEEITEAEIEYMKAIAKAGFYATDRVKEVNHTTWYGKYKDGVTPELLEKIGNLGNKQAEIEARMSLFTVPKSSKDILDIYKNLDSIKLQVNIYPSQIPRNAADKLSQQLNIIDKTMEIGRDNLLKHPRDTSRIISDLFDPKFENWLKTDDFESLDDQQNNLLIGKKSDGGEINTEDNFENSISPDELVAAVVSYLKIAMPSLFDDPIINANLTEFLLEQYLTAYQLIYYIEPKRAAIQSQIDIKKEKISTDFDTGVKEFENTKKLVLNNDFDKLKDIQALENEIQEYYDNSENILSEPQKTELNKFKQELKTRIETLINAEYTKIKTGLVEINTKKLQKNNNLNYEIETGDLNNQQASVLNFSKTLNTLNTNLGSYEFSEATKTLKLETQATLDKTKSIFEQITYAKTLSETPDKIINNAGKIYNEIQTIIAGDKFINGQPEFREDTSTSLKLKVANLVETIKPLQTNTDKLPSEIKRKLQICENILLSVNLIANFKHDNNTKIPDFLNWGWDNDFDNNYATLHSRIETPVEFLNKLRDLQKDLGKNSPLLTTFGPYFEIMETQLEQKLKWYVAQVNSKNTNYTTEQKIELNKLVRDIDILTGDPFAEFVTEEPEVITELIDDSN